MDKKRILLISLFLLMIVFLGFALWFVFFRTAAPQPGAPGTSGVQPTQPGDFPQAGAGQPTAPVQPGDTSLPSADPSQTPSVSQVEQPVEIAQIATDQVLGVTAGGDGVRFYNRSNGLFYRVDQNGRAQALTDEVFYNVDNVTWSPTQNESIIEYPDGSNIYYNFDTKKQVTLPKHWEDFSFSPEGNQLASKSVGFSRENRWLVSSNPDGTGITPIEHLGSNQDRVMVDWSPGKQIVALSRTGQQLGGDRQELLFVGLNGENYPSTVVEGRGLKTQWSKQGEKLLYSVYNARSNFQPELWVVNAQVDSIGSERRLLNLNTWADKCTFQDDRYVFCGVPQYLEAGSGFAPGLADQVPDRLFRIDTQTGIKTEIPLEQQHTVDSIFFNEQENAVYFTDKNDSGLFRASL